VIIQPGVPAVILGSICEENNGTLVTVGQFLGVPPIKHGIWDGRDYWNIDAPIMAVNTLTKQRVGPFYWCRAIYLVPLDEEAVDSILKKQLLQEKRNGLSLNLHFTDG